MKKITEIIQLDSVMRNLGNDEVIHLDYAKHGLVLRNLGDVDVLHVDLRETLSGHEQPRERPSNTRGLRRTWPGREKPRRRRRNTRVLQET